MFYGGLAAYLENHTDGIDLPCLSEDSRWLEEDVDDDMRDEMRRECDFFSLMLG